MRKAILTASAALAAVLGIGLAAAPAMASTGPAGQQFVTHSAQHSDTTNVTGACTGTSTNGPTWATDNLTEQFTVTPYGPGEYRVAVTVNGSFAGFADPTTGACLTSNGPVKGTIVYYVQSTTGPSGAALLPNQAPDTGLGAAIQQLFPGFTGYDWAPADAGAYTFTYQNGSYVQNTSGITGSIQGH